MPEYIEGVKTIMYKEYRQEEHWNVHYKKRRYAVLTYDGWLDKYLPKLPTAGKILDLGCGSGIDTEMLLKNGFLYALQIFPRKPFI